jgi:hypothetical protein
MDMKVKSVTNKTRKQVGGEHQLGQGRPLPLLVLREAEWAAPPTNIVHIHPLVGEPPRYSTHNTNKGES